MVFSKFPVASIYAFCPLNVNLYHYRKVQWTLHFTHSRASSSTPSLSNSQSTHLLSSLAAHRPYRSTVSTPFAIEDMSEPNEQNNFTLREPPLASQNYRMKTIPLLNLALTWLYRNSISILIRWSLRARTTLLQLSSIPLLNALTFAISGNDGHSGGQWSNWTGAPLELHVRSFLTLDLELLVLRLD